MSFMDKKVMWLQDNSSYGFQWGRPAFSAAWVNRLQAGTFLLQISELASCEKSQIAKKAKWECLLPQKVLKCWAEVSLSADGSSQAW